MIYFVQAGAGGPIKIGTSSQLTVRLSALASDRFVGGRTLRLLAVMDGGRQFERLLHCRFSHLKIEGEWHEPGEDLQDFIVAEGKEWDGLNDGPESNLLISYKSDPQTFDVFKEWMDGLADDVGVPVTILLDLALKDFAQRRKYKPMPKRLAR